jgi:hypothetical protein
MVLNEKAIYNEFNYLNEWYTGTIFLIHNIYLLIIYS